MVGILTTEQQQKVAIMLDEAVKLKGFAELLDGHLFRALIAFVDDTFVDKLNEELKQQLSDLITACINEDLEAAQTLAAELLNSLVDIPILEEQAEALIFKGVVELIVAAVLKWIESKKE